MDATGAAPGAGYDWGTQAHGLDVDSQDNVWVGFGGGLPYHHKFAGADRHAHILKFTPTGKFLRQFGKFGEGTAGSNSTTLLGQPTDVAVDVKTNEVYFSDGYTNRRVIVFDVNTGAYTATGAPSASRPDDAPMPAFNRSAPPRQAVRYAPLSRDGERRAPSTSATAATSGSRSSARTARSSRTHLINAKLADGVVGGTPWDIAFSTDPAAGLHLPR